MLFLALGVGEAEIDEFDAVLVNLVQHIGSGHGCISRIGGSKNRLEIVPVTVTMPINRAKSRKLSQFEP
jgi:hypothetical protein